MLIQSLGWGELPLFACGERTIAQSWLPEVSRSAALLSALFHGELSSCRKPCVACSCISRRAGSESQHPSAASCCFILPILYHSLSYASQPFQLQSGAITKTLGRNRVEVTAAGCMRATDLGKAEAQGQALGSWSAKLQHVVFLRLQTSSPSQVFPPQWTLDISHESPANYLGGFCMEIISI